MRYHTIPVDCRAASWPTRDGKGRCAFIPHGKKTWTHYKSNRQTWSAHDTLSARFFVGFNVGDKTVWNVQDLVNIVRKVREQQVGDPSSSFVSQLGIYRHKDRDLVVKEPGAQVIIVNLTSSSSDFRRQMKELGEEIAKQMDQEEVIIEIQRDGRTLITLGVNSEPDEPERATPNKSQETLDRLVASGMIFVSDDGEAIGTAKDGTQVVLGFVDEPFEKAALIAYLEHHPDPADW